MLCIALPAEYGLLSSLGNCAGLSVILLSARGHSSENLVLDCSNQVTSTSSEDMPSYEANAARTQEWHLSGQSDYLSWRNDLDGLSLSPHNLISPIYNKVSIL
jgi:hypothetical protein